mgnify:CR=1 FL=1
MTCIDGNAMARKGRGGAALCIAAVGSWVAGTFGVIMLTLLAPPLAVLALKFGPPEYTALLVLGLIFLAYMSSTSLVRTLLMAALGKTTLAQIVARELGVGFRATLSPAAWNSFGANSVICSCSVTRAKNFSTSRGPRKVSSKGKSFSRPLTLQSTSGVTAETMMEVSPRRKAA